MNRMTIAAIALFCLLYMLLGMRLGRRWGVDASRPTPAAETGRAKSAVLLLVRDVAVYAYFALEACRNMEASPSALLCLSAMIAMTGVIGYAALFVSIRHEGEGVAAAAGWEIGRMAEKAYHLLALLVSVPALAFVLRGLYASSGTGIPAKKPLSLLCALLFGLSALQNAQLTAEQIAHEEEGGALAMGGVLIAGLMTAASILGGGWPAICGRIMGKETGQILCVGVMLFASICALYALARLALASLHGLFRRELPVRKKLPPAAKAVLELAAIAASAAGCAWMMDKALWVCACAAVLLMLLSFFVCALWLRRIGRGLL